MGPSTDHHPFAAADTPSFHDLLDRVSADERLDPRRRADLRSAIKSLGQWLGRDLTAIPAHPQYLREQLAGFQPAAADVSRKRMQNVRSAIGFALGRYGLGGRRSYLAPLSPQAQALYDDLPDKYLRCRLSRLLHFISAQGIAPEQMDDAVADAFLAALEQHSAIKHVRTTHQDACRAWNKAHAEVAGWPDVQLTVPCYQHTYGLSWSDFPASLEAAVDAWFADPVDDGDFFADNGRMKPLAPRTVATQRDHLRCTASALVRSGHDPSAIVNLAYLVRPAHVRQALTFFLDRNDGKPNSYIAAIAYTLRTLAKYGVVLPDADRKEVERLYKKVAKQRHGMTEKNLARLRQLDDPAVRDRLLAFPTLRIREVLRKDSGGVAEALAVQAALATELWLFVPLRIANFVGLRLDQHLIRREDRRGERPWAIHVPAAMVKNAINLDFELPAPIARHLELYLEHFRPRLVAGTNPWLFPGRNGNAKHLATLREQVTRAVRQATGIELHPHLFRHIAGKLLLDEHPGDQGTVQRMLGHKSIRTTMATYTGAETRAAIRRYDEVVLGLRAQALSRAGSRSVMKRGERLSLDVADWPARDRAAWVAARQPVGPLDDGGLAAGWSAKTIRQAEKGYGLWLGCLARHGRLDPDAAPGARLIREALTLFGKELLARVAPQTAASRVRDLSVMIRALDPDADRALVKRMQAMLARRAPPSRAKRERMIAPSRLFAAGLARMNRVEHEQHRKHDVRNVRYRDGLMMAVLAARAFRRGNLQQMRVGRHITKVDGTYVCTFTAAETKNRRELVEPLPMALTPYIDRYLAEVRPALLRGHVSDAFWVSTYRRALSEQSIYTKICAATEEELGVRLNPHLFRDALATGIATDDPEHIRMASRLLGHADQRTTERHYIHAQALTASRRYNKVVLPLRDAAVAASSDEEDSRCVP